MIRPACGTARGMLEHQAAREWPCGWCVHAEQVSRLMAERVTPLPPEALRQPVTPAEARAHALLLDREVAAFDREHRGQARHRWLRSVAA